MGCPNYIAYIYLHLAVACIIAFCSAEFITVFESSWIAVWINIAVLFGSLFLIQQVLPPGSMAQYGAFVIFALSVGQLVQTSLQQDEHKQILGEVLATVAGIFVAMTALGFYDRQNLLGLGPYLFAALGGLILGQIAYITYYWINGKPLIGQSYLSDFAVVLFTLFIGYDTQRVKQKAGTCIVANYPNDSLGLFLDIVNLFLNVSR
jgi:FtsH-binding integral membrane protein